MKFLTMYTLPTIITTICRTIVS